MVRPAGPIKSIEQAQPSQYEIDAGSLLESRRPVRTNLVKLPKEAAASSSKQ